MTKSQNFSAKLVHGNVFIEVNYQPHIRIPWLDIFLEHVVFTLWKNPQIIDNRRIFLIDAVSELIKLFKHPYKFSPWTGVWNIKSYHEKICRGNNLAHLGLGGVNNKFINFNKTLKPCIIINSYSINLFLI